MGSPTRTLEGAALAAISLVGYIGVLKVEVAALRATQAMLNADLETEQGKYETCSARLTNIRERIESERVFVVAVGEVRGEVSRERNWFAI
mgnify:CR=1 FL=1